MLKLGIIFLALLVIVGLNNILPKKLRPILILLASLGIFFVFSKALIIFLIFSIISVYFIGNFLDKLNEKRDKCISENPDNKKEIKEKFKKKKRLVLLLGIIINVAFLFYFKYLNFFGTNINSLLNTFDVDFNFKLKKIIAPIGISFYSLEALSYILDVYYEKIKADKNIFRVALYLSFFPQIMEGPIARYSDTAEDLYSGKKITYNNLTYGLQRIIYGLSKKMIIADRLLMPVDEIFSNYANYNGAIVALGAIGYTIMLYMEFSGTIDMFIGMGEVLGVKIPENFRQPFFAKNISEFWTRWHISLGLWFKDYIFYPVSLSKSMKKLTIKARKVLGNRFGPLISGSIALFAVWFLNGLWHGAGWPFLFYGMYQFVMILMGNIFEPTIKNVCEKLHINRKNTFYRVFQSIKMTLFVFIGELFFRADTVSQGFKMLKRIFTRFDLIGAFKNSDFLAIGLDIPDYIILAISLVLLFIVGILREKNHNIREDISKKNIVVRWSIYYAVILACLIFGAYGSGYTNAAPMYADF